MAAGNEWELSGRKKRKSDLLCFTVYKVFVNGIKTSKLCEDVFKSQLSGWGQSVISGRAERGLHTHTP